MRIQLLAPALLLPLFIDFSKPGDAHADAALFTTLNCNKCHSITSMKIEKKAAKGEEEEEEETEPPDLSNVGKFHDAAYIKSFLKKDAAHTPHEGDTSTKRHAIKFKGTAEELNKMGDWLATLK